ncbi:MAG: hypothetical protein ABJL99_01635 [Aliishimia sp.]
MSETYDFSTGFNFTSWAKQFDGFHDWVILELRIFITDDRELAVQQYYRAELVVIDPYERFDINKIHFRFENVEASSLQGLSSLSSELSGLVVEKTSMSVRLASNSDNHLRVDAENLTIGLSGSVNT